MFEDYLTTRTQKVKYNQDVFPKDLYWVLFCLWPVYIKDLPQSLLKSSVGMYADNTLLAPAQESSASFYKTI